MVLDLAPHEARWCSTQHFGCTLVQYAAANCPTLVVRDSTEFFPEEIFVLKFRPASSYQR